MRKSLAFAVLLLCACGSAEARNRDPFLIYPFFSFLAPQKGIAASKETLQNMRFGCMSSVNQDEARKDCLELVGKLHGLVILSLEEIKHAELMGSTLSKEAKDALFAAIDKKYVEIHAISMQIQERYPYVRFYISPALRIAI